MWRPILKTRHPEPELGTRRWTDTKNINVASKEERTINLQLPPELRDKLLRARGELIEGECEVVE